MSSPKTRITGQFTDATVYIPPEQLEDGCYDQIQEMINHPAFREPVVVQPDAHVGKGSVIGFTMPLRNRVCPNTVGVDVGCGMYSFRLSNLDFDVTDENDLLEIDRRVRESVPMGRSVRSDGIYNVKEDFSWEEFRRKWVEFATTHLTGISEYGDYNPETFDPDVQYFKDLCKRVDYSQRRAINSVGSLGGGNHFIEFSLDSDQNVWCTIHSGSRGIGKAIAEYHQSRANKLRKFEFIRQRIQEIDDEKLQYIKFDPETVSDMDMLEWIEGGKGESFVNYEALREDYGDTEPDKIETIGQELKTLIPAKAQNAGPEDASQTGDTSQEHLDYLEGKEAVEYYVDMAFGQTYARESRKLMAHVITEQLNAHVEETVESIHNYIDYTDGIIRKGAIPAHEGEKGIIPMNMSQGAFLVHGKGNENWNFSAPHGAGRAMGRREAEDKLDKTAFEEQMQDIVATELPLDEAPDAYKDMEFVRQQMTPTVDVIDHLQPFLNLKADE